jgi:hypothetical protein
MVALSGTEKARVDEGAFRCGDPKTRIRKLLILLVGPAGLEPATRPL